MASRRPPRLLTPLSLHLYLRPSLSFHSLLLHLLRTYTRTRASHTPSVAALSPPCHPCFRRIRRRASHAQVLSRAIGGGQPGSRTPSRLRCSPLWTRAPGARRGPRLHQPSDQRSKA
jgi:hypothetical protein